MPSKVIDKVHHHVSKLVDEDNDMAGNNKFLKGFNKLAEASMDDEKKETDA